MEDRDDRIAHPWVPLPWVPPEPWVPLELDYEHVDFPRQLEAELRRFCTYAGEFDDECDENISRLIL